MIKNMCKRYDNNECIKCDIDYDFFEYLWSLKWGKIPRETQLSQRTFCNLELHLAFTVCENLVKIQYLRHECSSIMYENTQKN